MTRAEKILAGGVEGLAKAMCEAAWNAEEFGRCCPWEGVA